MQLPAMLWTHTDSAPIAEETSAGITHTAGICTTTCDRFRQRGQGPNQACGKTGRLDGMFAPLPRDRGHQLTPEPGREGQRKRRAGKASASAGRRALRSKGELGKGRARDDACHELTCIPAMKEIAHA